MSDIKKSDFSITFWIKVVRNPGWTSKESEINFPPFTIKPGIQVFFSKYGEKMKVYILHPDLGYRKIEANVEKYLQGDAFVVLTNSHKESKLYLNTDLLATIKRSNLIQNIEIGDYVMVNVQDGDLKNVTINKKGTKIILPAKIQNKKDGKVILNFFNIKEISELPISRIYY